MAGIYRIVNGHVKPIIFQMRALLLRALLSFGFLFFGLRYIFIKE